MSSLDIIGSSLLYDTWSKQDSKHPVTDDEEDDFDTIDLLHDEPQLEYRKSNSDFLCNYTKPVYPWEVDGYSAILEIIVMDNGREKNGFFVLVNKQVDMAKIVPFMEESYYSSKAGILEHRCVWQGSLSRLIDMSKMMMDLKVAGRILDPNDFDYNTWKQMYDAIQAWHEQGQPLWQGRLKQMKHLHHWCSQKTPIAYDVIKSWNEKNKAAAKIQAAYRAWKWRINVLYNPHTIEGQHFLKTSFYKI